MRYSKALVQGSRSITAADWGTGVIQCGPRARHPQPREAQLSCRAIGPARRPAMRLARRLSIEIPLEERRLEMRRQMRSSTTMLHRSPRGSTSQPAPTVGDSTVYFCLPD